jgi:hypothetical protein
VMDHDVIVVDGEAVREWVESETAEVLSD